ncbi:MAG: hypothetical protein ACI8PZ_000984 [Myxococcota bacterium]|jgi:hypothetical protein
MSEPEAGEAPAAHTEQAAPAADASEAPVAFQLIIGGSVFFVLVWALWIVMGGGPGQAPRPDID